MGPWCAVESVGELMDCAGGCVLMKIFAFSDGKSK